VSFVEAPARIDHHLHRIAQGGTPEEVAADVAAELVGSKDAMRKAARHVALGLLRSDLLALVRMVEIGRAPTLSLEGLTLTQLFSAPTALERVLATAHALTAGRLGVVFGCGGDRDRGKRPLMGEIAARLADRVWVTSDNPRSERPGAIIDEIVAGIRRVSPEAGRYVTMPERQGAIEDALLWARAGDCVVIAGKGHETYQLVGPAVLPFDDREVARAILRQPA